MRPASSLLISIALLLVLSSSAWGHKVRIFAWQEGDQILTESKFSGGRPAINATVEVVNPLTSEILLSGSTDRGGNYSFPLSEIDPTKRIELKELDIIVDSGDGHKNHWLYSLEENDHGQQADHTHQIPEPAQQVVKKPAASEGPPQLLISKEELQYMLDATIEKKLSPIRKSLAESSEKGPSLQDILGGLGYIFGLAGIAAYMQAKKNNKKE